MKRQKPTFKCLFPRYNKGSLKSKKLIFAFINVYISLMIYSVSNYVSFKKYI